MKQTPMEFKNCLTKMPSAIMYAFERLPTKERNGMLQMLISEMEKVVEADPTPRMNLRHLATLKSFQGLFN